LSWTWKNSAAALAASGRTGTWIVLTTSPGAKFSVPLVAVKSRDDLAVPSKAVYDTFTVEALALDKATVKTASTGEPCSATVASWIERVGMDDGITANESIRSGRLL